MVDADLSLQWRIIAADVIGMTEAQIDGAISAIAGFFGASSRGIPRSAARPNTGPATPGSRHGTTR